MTNHYDIFISYRRDGGFETAKHLNDLLVRDGYTVSFDIDTLREGDFDDNLLKRIDQCVDFILVVDKHTFDRTLDPDFDPKKDWLRTELAYALKLRKNIIPLLLSGVDGFPPNLPVDVADVATKNGPEYNKYYFDEFYRRLKSFLHSVPRNAKDDTKDNSIFDNVKALSSKILLFVILLIAALMGVFVINQAISKNKAFLNILELPENLRKTGFTKEFVEQNINEFITGVSTDAGEKLENVIRDISFTANRADEESDMLAFSLMDKIEVQPQAGWLVKEVRRLLGKKDVCISLKLLETDNSYVGKVIVVDWTDKKYSKVIEAFKDKFPNEQKCAMDVIKQSAGYATLAYSPIVSALYDYNYKEGLDEYEMTNPWKEGLYENSERVKILEDALSHGSADSTYCLMLLGYYYDNLGRILSNDIYITKACSYYETCSMSNIKYSKLMKDRINYLRSFSSSDDNSGVLELLVKNKLVPVKGICQQLIVVTNQEIQRIDGEDYYKATLYKLEKNGENWAIVSAPFSVNVGVKGIAEEKEKREGDVMTPSGFYPISFAFGVQKNVETKMEFRELNKYHVWVCDTSSEDYNRWVEDITGKYLNNKKNEHLLSIQPQYKYAIVIDYNTNPIVKGLGSAIFIHVQKTTHSKTAGCIAMAEKDIVDLIKWIDPSKKPHILITK